MSKLSELKSRWLKDKSAKAAYDKQALEFAIAHKLISKRLKANLSQKEIAQKMGTTHHFLDILKTI